ncbi:hypothetical protein PISMIDRAFT_687438 [Pisolithus microcarpus 441]|uniref:Uncharacterized protein n=1 Tax=Pisolithus microcarpus 441 TaxID=765257 RepID=A0A0C9YMM9_9AGAM|nr:hypothetical protein PISMIDRAFT_687438 [Pisolithus microcarpus 441]
MVGSATIFKLLAQAWPSLLSGSGIPRCRHMGRLKGVVFPKNCVKVRLRKHVGRNPAPQGTGRPERASLSTTKSAG